MSYQAEISRANPTCFFFLIDQSSSMQEPIMGVRGNPSKADFVTDAINNTIQSLILAASKDKGVRRYYQIGALGYGNKITSLLDYLQADEGLVWIDDLAETPRRIEEREKKVSDGAGGFIGIKSQFPVWIDSLAYGGTPMCEALAKTKDILESWVLEHPDSYPPTIMNFTDGEATDGDPVSIAQELKSLSTRDGETLVFTLHISSNQFSTTLVCPDVDEVLPDAASRRMFQMSSELTAKMITMAKEAYDLDFNQRTKAFAYNGNIEDLVTLIDIGSWNKDLR